MRCNQLRLSKCNTVQFESRVILSQPSSFLPLSSSLLCLTSIFPPLHHVHLHQLNTLKPFPRRHFVNSSRPGLPRLFRKLRSVSRLQQHRDAVYPPPDTDTTGTRQPRPLNPLVCPPSIPLPSSSPHLPPLPSAAEERRNPPPDPCTRLTQSNDDQTISMAFLPSSLP